MSACWVADSWCGKALCIAGRQPLWTTCSNSDDSEMHACHASIRQLATPVQACCRCLVTADLGTVPTLHLSSTMHRAIAMPFLAMLLCTWRCARTFTWA